MIVIIIIMVHENQCLHDCVWYCCCHPVAMWGEQLDGSDIDKAIWPRAAAAAERLWTPFALTTDNATAAPRLAAFRCLLLSRGIGAAPMGMTASGFDRSGNATVKPAAFVVRGPEPEPRLEETTLSPMIVNSRHDSCGEACCAAAVITLPLCASCQTNTGSAVRPGQLLPGAYN